MKKLIPFLILIITFFYGCKNASIVQQTTPSANIEKSAESDFRIMTYNVENLFDLYDDTLKKDDDFLPWGMYKWNAERYQTKLKKIFKVITNLSEWEYPALIALTEIENQRVLEDLVQATPLTESDFNIIHEESPDERGIDVALLYRRSLFRPIQHQIIPVTMPQDPHFKTRDILYVSGIINKTDTLHFFVVHFPSRRGGEAISEPKRILAAEKVRAKCDSILNKQAQANIIITGDFNDEPSNASVYEVLRGKGDLNEMQDGDFFNMMYAAHKKGHGSYKFQSSWNMLDQYIISPALLNPDHSIYTTTTSAHIFQPDWLSVKDDVYPGVKPNRTYSGPSYLGGYSDHYPIFMDIFFKK
ncbi:MAG: hypothetical protein M9958_05860 [Chitinophagales bacterium]|nr:hypothetical protein [Chitinophagales bacterium]